MIDAKDAVVSHLMFHKSLLENEEDGTRIDNYIELVDNLDEKLGVNIDDPYERSIAMALHLAVEERFDPWNVNLIKFSREYIKRVRKCKDTDFIASGKLIFLAWSVLKLQSEELLKMAEPQVQKAQIQEAEWEWAPEFMDMLYEPAEEEMREKLVQSEPLEEQVRHNETRKVSLIELIDAFDEAKREAELQKRINEARSRLRKSQAKPDVTKKIHRERLIEEIEDTWRTLSGFADKKVPFKELCSISDLDLFSLFVSILFLAKEEKVTLKQKKFPYGKITIEVREKLKEGEEPIIEIILDADEGMKKEAEALVTT